MKTILRILILLILSTSSVIARDLRKMSKYERNEIILRKCKKAIFKYAPGYSRNFAPEITLVSESYVESIIRDYDAVLNGTSSVKYSEESKKTIKKNQGKWISKAKKGRRWYNVTYPFDHKVEAFPARASIGIFIWADTHEVFCITAGSMVTLWNLDETFPLSRKKKFIPYKKFPPQKIYVPRIVYIGKQ